MVTCPLSKISRSHGLPGWASGITSPPLGWPLWSPSEDSALFWFSGQMLRRGRRSLSHRKGLNSLCQDRISVSDLLLWLQLCGGCSGYTVVIKLSFCWRNPMSFTCVLPVFYGEHWPYLRLAPEGCYHLYWRWAWVAEKWIFFKEGLH